MKDKPYLVVGAVVIKQERVLVGKRLDGPYKDKYCFPGGKVEDETLIAALIRELEEETGLTTMDLPTFLGYTEQISSKTNRRYVCMFYLVKDFVGEPKELDHNTGPWEWLTWEELEKAPKIDSMEEFFLRVYPKIENYLEKIVRPGPSLNKEEIFEWGRIAVYGSGVSPGCSG